MTFHVGLHENKRRWRPGLCGCGRACRSWGQYYCRECHNRFMRGWRKTHPVSGEAARRAIARAYLRVYIIRGKIVRGPCNVCAAAKTEGHHLDYSKPLEVVWLCRRHHLELHHRKMHRQQGEKAHA